MLSLVQKKLVDYLIVDVVAAQRRQVEYILGLGTS